MVHVCSLIYPEISSPDNKELCGVVLEASFFPALMEHLRTVYRYTVHVYAEIFVGEIFHGLNFRS